MTDPLKPSEPADGETTPPYTFLGGDEVGRGLRLYRTAVWGLVLLCSYLAYSAKVTDFLHIYLGLTILVLASIPSLIWAKSGGSRFPIFEPIMLLCANTYALPLLNGKLQLAVYPPEVVTKAALAVIIYQVCAIGAYQFVSGRPGTSRFWLESILHRQVERALVYGLVLSTGYVTASTFTDWIPSEINSILRAIFFGIGILCTFVGAQRWGQGALTQTEKTYMIIMLGLQVIFQMTSLLLVTTISLLGIGLLGYLSGSKRIPWAATISAFLIVAVLHNGKDPMREKHWTHEEPLPGITGLPGFYTEWIEHGLRVSLEDEAGQKSASRRLLERTSLMHILCLVVEWTPDRQAYLQGETYGYVLPQLIPRFIWPDKPRSHVSTYRLGIYYGLQDEDATHTTTIAFGMLTEAYANFGFIGAMLLGFFWGASLKKLQVLGLHSPMFSQAGLVMILLTAWGFNVELTMAAWVSSLFQALIFVIGVPMLVRGFLGD